MALTQISTQGIKDGTITGSDLATNVDLVDNQKLRIGTGNDLQIYHDGSHSYALNTTGNLFLGSNNSVDIGDGDFTEYAARFIHDGAVELYHDHSKKFETTNYGAKVTGRLAATTSFTGSDNVKLKLGDSDDLQIFHDGTDSFIKQATGTRLRIQGVGSNGATVHIQARSDEEGIKLLNNTGESKVELYYDNSKKFETTSSGATISGNLLANTASGRSTELHSSGIGIIRDSKSLDLNANYAGANTHSQINSTNTQLRLGISNSDTLRVTTDSIILTDNKKAIFGTGNDLQIYHDGNHSIISDSGPFATIIQSKQLNINNAANSERLAEFNENAAVELYYDGSKKFETTSSGVLITGTTTLGGNLNVNTQNILFGDSATSSDDRLTFGAGNDLQIYHDSNDSYIDDAGSGNLLIRGSVVQINKANSAEVMAKFTQDGAVELYYDNSKMLETTSAGVTLVGETNFTSHSLKIRNWGLVANYKGLFHANHGTATSEFILINNETNTILGTGSGGIIKLEVGGNGEDAINCYHNGAVELYYDNSKKFETLSNGARVQGGLLFGSDTAAANALDDYEEGTWTPTASGFTISNNYSANYTKIGNVVYIQMYIVASGGSGVSAVSIGGLPYTVKAGNYYSYAAGRIGGSASAGNDKVFEFINSSTNVQPRVADGPINEGMISGQHLIMSGFYHVA